jgi:hypothetical protein
LGLLDGLLGGGLHGGHHEVGLGTSLKRGGVLKHRMQIVADASFDVSGKIRSRHGINS